MEFSKLMIITFITVLLQTLFPLILSADSTETSLFRAYIGAGSNKIKFSDVPISPDVEFHFMLAFAVDCTAGSPGSPSSPTDGLFNVFWDKDTLTPDEVSAIKNNNNNVKVVLSIGGDSCGTDPLKFNADSVDLWVSNAVSSLTEIIKEYNLDGIDIDYEKFSPDSDNFSECMGQVVSQLKKEGTISIASIAPFADDDVQTQYGALWKSYGGDIDYVNFQFYAYEQGTTVSEFIDYFDLQSSVYNGGKIVAGFATDGRNGGLSTDDDFFEACKQLKSDGKLAGIFVWSADDSKADGFSFENQAQTVLAAGDESFST